MDGKGELIVAGFEELRFFRGIADFIFGVEDAGGIVYGNLHVEGRDKSVGPAGFLLHRIRITEKGKRK